jgi:outer membrane protein assembly factor BamB
MNAARLSLLALGLALLTLPALALDWPQWRGPNRDDVSKETGLLKTWPEKGPPLLWTCEDTGVGYAGFAVVGDRLYTMGAFGNVEKLFALDVGTGKKVWELEIGALLTNGWGDGPRGTPTVAGDRVYAIAGRGRLVCADAASGQQHWAVEMTKDLKGGQPGWGYTESPLVDGDLVLCTPGGSEGTIAALDRMTGKVVWRSEVKFGAHYSSIVPAQLGGIKQYVQLTRDGVFGVAAKDGKKLWHVAVGGCGTATIPTPIIHDGHVFVTSGYGDSKSALVKVTGDNGSCKAEIVWEGKQLINKHGGVVLVEGVLYGSPEGGRSSWLAVDFKSGEQLGLDKAKLGKGSLTYADGRLYLYSEDKGTCVLLEPDRKEWKEQGRFTIPRETKVPRKSGRIWTHPVVANGRLYLRDQDLLFCFDVKAQ